MYQKSRILVHKVIYHDADLLEKKYSLEKYYKELIRTAEDNKCLNENSYHQLIEKYKELKGIKGHIDQNYLADFIRLAYKFDAEVKQVCK
ncbi:MAG: hypothetical protein GXP45_01105 [bacterium]|nr:hypothetical protein [bacterium]